MIISTKNFGENVRKMREQAWYSQEALAESCGLQTKTISRIELGKSFPNLKTLVAIVNFLKSTNGFESNEQVFLQIEQ